MKTEPFITPALSGWLDLARAMSALVVVVGHARQLGLYEGPYPFTIALQLNAVVIFFVLSGLVIAHSAARPGAAVGKYAAARVARILPVAWPALALSWMAAVYCQARGFPPAPVETDPGTISILRTIRAGLFIDEGYGGGFAINPPFWSLAYEVWFYVLFAIATWMKGPARLIALAVAACIAGPNVLALLPVWLCGVALVRSSPLRRTLPVFAALVFIAIWLASLYFSVVLHIGLAPLAAPLAAAFPGHSHYAASYLVLGATTALAFAGARSLAGEARALPQWLKPAVRWMADMSFSLYLLHWPVLMVIKASGFGAGGSVIAFVAIIGAVVAICGLFAAGTEQRREPFRRWLEAKFTPRRPAAPAAATA